jgi:hypothetical protein
MPASDLFDRISNALDPSFRYLIICCDTKKRTLDVQRDILDIFGHNGIHVLEKKVYHDHKLNRQYLVLKLDPDLAKAPNFETLYALMPKDNFWYFYEKTS